MRALQGASPEELAAWRRLVDRVGPATLAGWLAPPALLAAMLADTALLTAMLESLRDDDPANPTLAALPEVAALAAPAHCSPSHRAADHRHQVQPCRGGGHP